MDTHDHHGEWVKGFMDEQKAVFNLSDQAMYVFLDDDCRVCNDKFATLLGYSSADEWMNVNVNGAFPAVFVDPKSHTALVSAYQAAMTRKVGSTIPVTWQKKSGGTVDTTVILVPVAYQGHLFALHFVS